MNINKRNSWNVRILIILLLGCSMVYSQNKADWGCQICSGNMKMDSQYSSSNLSALSSINKKCIVILCKYVGEADPWNPTNFDGGHSMHQYLSSTYATSFRNYFADMSHNEHILSSRLDGVADITKWYQIPTSATDTPAIIREAMKAVDSDINRGWHWSDYDSNNDYITDQVMVIPSSSMDSLGSTMVYVTINSTTEPGMTVGGNVPITRGWNSWDFLVGNMGHEYGHELGLPELYDRDYPTPVDYSAGVGYFCLMGHGHYNRAIMSCWSRAKLGWIDVQEITSNTLALNVPPIQISRTSAAKDKVFKIVADNTLNKEEYFLIENRKALTYYPTVANGIVIWHVDESINHLLGDPDKIELHKGVDVECADGLFTDKGYPGTIINTINGRDNLDFFCWTDPVYNTDHNGNRGDATDSFTPGMFNSFTPYTNPNSNRYNGDARTDTLQNIASHVAITNLQDIGGNTYKIDVYKNWWSTNTTATAYNNQRKLILESSGKCHLVHESGGEIYYQYSDDNGVTWKGRFQLSSGNGNNQSPCIAFRDNKLFVVWQRYDGIKYDIFFRKSTNGGTNWGNVSEIASDVLNPLPVIISQVTNELMVVYRFENNLKYKRSTNYGDTWYLTGTINAGSGETLNSPSVTETRLGAVTGVTGLAYATKLLPNASHIITRTYSNGAWSVANNISIGLSGVYSQHANPSVSHSGDLTTNFQHVSWDAFDAVFQSRVILHYPGNTWNFNGQYYELHYQSEDRPSITGLTGSTAKMAYQSGSNLNHFLATFNGSSWTVGSSISGFHPSFSMGRTSAKYAWTSGTVSPYTVNLSTTTFSKADGGVTDNPLYADYIRSIAVVDTASGAWFDIRMEKISINDKGQNISEISIVDVPSSISLTVANAFNYLSSKVFTTFSTTDTVKIQYLINGEKLNTLIKDILPVQVNASIEDQNGKNVNYRVLTPDPVTFSKKKLTVMIPLKDFNGKNISIKTWVSGISERPGLVVSLGHIYNIIDATGLGSIDAFEKIQTIVPKPEKFSLDVFPNPFNPITNIHFNLPEEGNISLWIYNVQGERVKKLIDGYRKAGEYTLQWDGNDDKGNRSASGTYILFLETPLKRHSSKILLIK
jgi:M6 family metalloprotease-like protein